QKPPPTDWQQEPAGSFAKLLKRWQEWQGSNLRPPVLETGALPIELHSCREPARAPLRAVQAIGHTPIARAKRLPPYPKLSICARLGSHKQQAQRERP